MLTCKICVNDTMIIHIYIVNQSEYYSRTGQQEYRYEIYEPDKPLIKGTVNHNAEDGALQLIGKIIKQAEDLGETT